MNTVFKFYYQAWVMLGCASAYGVWWLLDRLERPASRLLVLARGGIVDRSGNGLSSDGNPQPGLPILKDLLTWMESSGVARNNPDDWAAIQWLDAECTRGYPCRECASHPGSAGWIIHL